MAAFLIDNLSFFTRCPKGNEEVNESLSFDPIFCFSRFKNEGKINTFVSLCRRDFLDWTCLTRDISMIGMPSDIPSFLPSTTVDSSEQLLIGDFTSSDHESCTYV